MTGWPFDSLTQLTDEPSWLTAAEWFGRASLITLCGVLGVLALRNSSSARRHQVLAITACALLALPVLHLMLPTWTPLTLVTTEIESLPPDDVAVDLSDVPHLPPVVSIGTADLPPSHPRKDALPTASNANEVKRASATNSAAMRAATSTEPTITESPNVPRSASRSSDRSSRSETSSEAEHTTAPSSFPWLAMIWGMGVAVCMAPYAAGIVALLRLKRGAAASKELNALAQQLERPVRSRRRVRFLTSSACEAPMTWGVFRPVIMLPANFTQWSRERQRVAILHELGHVVRRDCLSQLIEQLARAVYWFHPLVWWMSYRMRIEQEGACDDFVLGNGVPDTDYAELLVGFLAEAGRPKPTALVGAGMPGFGAAQRRLRWILDPHRTRREVTKLWWTITLLVGGMLLVPTAMLTTRAVAANTRVPTPPRDLTPASTQPVAKQESNEPDENRPPKRPATPQKYEGKTIEEWIAEFDKNQYRSNQEAKKQLIAIGAPAVGPLQQAIAERRKSASRAIQTLCQMGPDAKAALPFLLELAADRNAKQPAEWTTNVPMRALIFGEARHMAWAAEQWIPVLRKAAVDPQESETHRRRALYGLGGLGEKAEPVLRELAAHEDDDVRRGAVEALATVAKDLGGTRSEIFRQAIEDNPLDANVATYLVRMKNSYNLQRLHPLTQRVKAILRSQEKPTAKQQLALASIIRNGLANTDLSFAAPTDRGSSKWDREDPAESYATMEKALLKGLELAEPGTPLEGMLGRSLARLRLLRGDFDGMNAALAKIGQPPVPADRRATLPAPPADWKNLAETWKPADEAMRSGTSAIELEFEKDGKPLAGAHVLIKRRPEPRQGFRSGISVDTLLHATQPLETRPYDAFGYMAADRAQTRYAVTDATGKVRIEKLPAVPIVVEALVPTSNFAEVGHNWDMLLEIDGQLRPAPWGHSNSVDRRKGPALIELEEGKTTKYPKFIVRRQLILDVLDWSPADPENFVLSWHGPAGDDDRIDHYEVELMLTAPIQHTTMVTQQRVLKSWRADVRGKTLDVGKEGVGGGKLHPGNIYMFEVRAVDKQGKIVARLPRTRVWVPWKHRESKPPSSNDNGFSGSPFYDRIWWRTNTIDGEGNRETLPEAIARYIEDNEDGFEFEYVLLGEAWLFYHDGLHDAGKEQLEELASELPPGNVVRGTARMLLKLIAAGKDFPKRLEFAADE